MYFVFSEKKKKKLMSFYYYFFLKGEVIRGRNNAQEDEKNHRGSNGLQETGLKIKAKKIDFYFAKKYL